MIRRQLTSLIRQRLRKYPAVAIVGPRQSGKTTLARSLGGIYFDLEVEADRTRLDVEWPDLVRGAKLIILDEAQAWPPVFPRLRSAIDQERRRKGRFLLLGSVSPGLTREISESLAGRLALCELTPFLCTELSTRWRRQAWVKGGYPEGGSAHPDRYPDWQRNYLALLAQRDLPQWGLPAKPNTTERLFRMIAALNGTLLNLSQVGKSLGLSYHTVGAYLEHLQRAFLIRFLAPYHANLSKRVTKSPKIYWRDSGLLHALLGVGNEEHLLAQPWVSHSWEGWVIEQILGQLSTAGVYHEPYHLRTSDGHEIDLILKTEKEVWAIEIKLTTDPTPAQLGSLRKNADLIRADRAVLLTRHRKVSHRGPVWLTNLESFLRVIR